jgi:hypothetical protein
VDRSTFGGLGVTLHYDGSRQVKLDSARVSLDLQQMDALLRSFKDLRPHFAKVQSALGQIELQNLTLSGAYDDPSKWTFSGAGRFDQVEITHADFPDRITLSRGKFDMSRGRIMFSDAAAAMSDASLSGGGTLEYGKARPLRCEMSGVGAELLNISVRIFVMPLGAMRRFTPTGEPRDNEDDQVNPSRVMDVWSDSRGLYE